MKGTERTRTARTVNWKNQNRNTVIKKQVDIDEKSYQTDMVSRLLRKMVPLFWKKNVLRIEKFYSKFGDSRGYSLPTKITTFHY